MVYNDGSYDDSDEDNTRTKVIIEDQNCILCLNCLNVLLKKMCAPNCMP